MTARERAAWTLARILVFSFLVVNYWEPLPGIAWLLLFVVFVGGVHIKLT